ncbi:hypothetical protein MIDIC_230142 [Alphaproteobacteria bacterium]
MDTTNNKKQNDKTIIIKKYPNRRLYNTLSSCYVTLEGLIEIIKEDYDVQVIDAKTGEDITKVTLIQVIFEQQQKEHSYVMTTPFLKQIIKFNDNSIHGHLLSEYINALLGYFNQSITHIQNSFNNDIAAVPLNPLQLWQQSLVYFNQQNSALIYSLLAITQRSCDILCNANKSTKK